jgi:hypothetical protein
MLFGIVRNDGCSGIVLPVVIGLVVGVAFIVSFAYFISNLNTRIYEGPGELHEFDTPDQHSQEVKLFLEKYSTDVLEGFSRNTNKTITFYYEVAKAVDTDDDGYRDTPRHLDLTLTYDESGGAIESNPNAKLVKMQIRCTEPSPTDIRTFVEILPPADDSKVLEFIQNARCIF